MSVANAHTTPSGINQGWSRAQEGWEHGCNGAPWSSTVSNHPSMAGVASWVMITGAIRHPRPPASAIKLQLSLAYYNLRKSTAVVLFFYNLGMLYMLLKRNICSPLLLCVLLFYMNKHCDTIGKSVWVVSGFLDYCFAWKVPVCGCPPTSRTLMAPSPGVLPALTVRPRLKRTSRTPITGHTTPNSSAPITPK